MRDSQHDAADQRDGDIVSRLAAEALSQLVAREGKVGSALSETVLDKVTKAVTSSDGSALEALKPDLRRHRVSDADLVDIYFPKVARNLGVDWEMDRISFAALSIAVARMQAFLRDVGAKWASDGSDPQNVATVLVLVPDGETHTLGPMTVVGQLRRRGISVSLRIAAKAEDIKAILRSKSFDGVIVSVACWENLALCGRLVKALKDGSGGMLRVALGGAVLFNGIDAKAATGADIATNDLTAALTAFGLNLPVKALEPENG
jgi:MerR family transcriptional regulator, light-induced transcriptional regulator